MSTTPQDLMQDLQRGNIGRREFIARALALEVSLSGIEAILASCGGSSSAPGATTITWTTFGAANELDRFKKFTDDFNSKHTDVQAQFNAIPSAADYSAKILTELTSHTASDVFQSGDQDIARYIKANLVLELTSLLTGPKSQSKPDDVFPGLWGDGQDARRQDLWCPHRL